VPPQQAQAPPLLSELDLQSRHMQFVVLGVDDDIAGNARDARGQLRLDLPFHSLLFVGELPCRVPEVLAKRRDEGRGQIA
jgi:hypothetical protein